MKQKILFLHGLESNNKGDKVDFLKERAEVLAPAINYQDEALEEKLMYMVEKFESNKIRRKLSFLTKYIICFQRNQS